MKTFSTILNLAQVLVPAVAAQSTDYSRYVNLFLGTDNGGNMFPGVVAAPFSMTKIGPDVRNGRAEAYSGYLPDGVITGFSMMHESGTGGAPKYGVVSQLPFSGDLENPLSTDIFVSRSADDEASVGYYKTSLSSGVVVELSGTEHAGLFTYSFPSGNTSTLIVDVSHVLPSFRGMGWSQGYAGGNFSYFPDGHYEGSGTYNNGWNLAPDWTIHFCGRFSASPSTSRTFSGSSSSSIDQFDTQTTVNGTNRVGGVFTFDQSEFSSTVGISFISSERACQYADDEISSGTSMSDLVQRSRDRWNSDVFSRITTSSTNDDALTMLYSSLYGMHLLPSNRTGEAPWPTDEPYYDDFFTFWDTFRCHVQLMHVLQPRAYEEVIRALIDIWRHDGFMPDARSSNFNGRTQGGSNADNVLADAYVKGVRGAINWEDGFAAMVSDAEDVPPPNNDPSARDSSTKEGRGGLPDWKTHGYVSTNYTRSVTRAVEYSVNDFALYQVARGLGRSSDASKYLSRSHNWQNHWSNSSAGLGHSGFMVPISPEGVLDAEHDPLDCGACYWAEDYYQGLPWEYSMNPHHDMASLIAMAGGASRFVDRLEAMFTPGNAPGNSPDDTIFNPGNEPSLSTPYLFHFAGAPARSVRRARDAARAYYGPGRDGLPGNSDAGALQSWLLWNMLGLYPVAAQPVFLLHSPWFSNVTVDLGGGRTLAISSEGAADADSRPHGPDTDVFVQSVRVNGQAWPRSWLAFDDVFADGGGAVHFVLGPRPSDWATGPDAPLPPSPASFPDDDARSPPCEKTGY
ncbi:putative alpha-1,2-mannosidase [Lineolata rhizophorae]|uniref:Putative alpha-1,2-mannosidase n=1 Tax=Lineolata rhizophorae TaxID=578093 RepID=A0A6A6NM76_9PEZI|nr:putative alpha-1,2-mannosidase [Lineolata rhizophorae]